MGWPISLAETRLQLALDAGGMGTWTSDLATGLQIWDRRQFELFGVPPDFKPTRESFLAMVLPDDRPLVEWNPADLKPDAGHLSQFRIRRPDGSIRWIASSSVTRKNPSGDPVELVGVNWDITQQKNFEIELVEAERRLSLATAAASIGIWDWNVETGAFYYSERARQIYGFSPGEAITFDRLRPLTHPEDFKLVEPALARALDPAQRSQESYRYRITKADTGEERWLLAHGGAVFSSERLDAKPLRYTGTLQDITDEVRLEAELRDERARLELALSAGEFALWELDPQTGVVTHSPTLNRIYGFPEDATPSYQEFAGRYAPGENERLEAEASNALSRGETSIRVEAKYTKPDGSNGWISVRAQILTDQSGVPTRVIGVAMDDTERRQWEDTLVTTAAELQHRVKNTLAVVQSVARQTFGPQSPADDRLTAFYGRLHSLAAATDLITRNNWTSVPLRDLVDEVAKPFSGSGQIAIAGGAAHIDSRDAANLSMCLHELFTNSVKHGALSSASGRVSVGWSDGNDRVVIRWKEEDGPSVIPPKLSGFGTKLLQSGAFGPSGSVDLNFLPEGLQATLILGRANPVTQATDVQPRL